MSVISRGAPRNPRAARMPPKPPPTMTTRWALMTPPPRRAGPCVIAVGNRVGARVRRAHGLESQCPRSWPGRHSSDGQHHLAAPAPLQAARERLARRREREDLDGRAPQLAGIGEPRDRPELVAVRLDGEVLAAI